MYIWENGEVRITHYLTFKYLTTMELWNVDFCFVQIHNTSTLLLVHVSKVVNNEGNYGMVQVEELT